MKVNGTAGVVGAALALVATAQAAEKTRTYDLTGFDEIVVEGVYEVMVEVGPDFGVELTGDQKWLALSEVEKAGDRLVLGTKKDGERQLTRRGRNAVRAVVTLPSLNAVAMKGVGSLEVEGVDAEAFTATLEGVGSVELAGTCADLTARVEGVGSLNARDLECEDVEVDVEGIGSATVFASRSVDADMDGMGSIDVWGKPSEVRRSKSFLSSIDVH